MTIETAATSGEGTSAHPACDLSIVIVNWNSVDFLRKCLQSVFETVTQVRFEVIVIDNASRDGCGEMLACKFPSVRFLQSDENLGFSGANNLGFRLSRGETVLFLNPDTEVYPGAIEKMVAALMATPDAGIVGLKLLNTDGTIQTSCIQSLPTILNQAFDLEFLRRRFPRLALWGMRPLFEENGLPAEVQVISGACLMLRRGLFEQIGEFETSYFMYSEDVDLCLKSLRAGMKNYYVGDAVTVHHGGQSSSASSTSHFGAVMMRESLFRYFRLRRSPVYAMAYRISTSLVSCFRLMALGGVLLIRRSEPWQREARSAAAKWAKVFRWSIGLENWAAHAGVQPHLEQTT